MIEQCTDHRDVVLQAGLVAEVEVPSAGAVLAVRRNEQKIVPVGFGFEVAVDDLLLRTRSEAVELEDDGNIARSVIRLRDVQLVRTRLSLEVECRGRLPGD